MTKQIYELVPLSTEKPKKGSLQTIQIKVIEVCPKLDNRIHEGLSGLFPWDGKMFYVTIYENGEYKKYNAVEYMIKKNLKDLSLNKKVEVSWFKLIENTNKLVYEWENEIL